MTPDDDKPLTPAQARQKLQKGLEDYLAGNDTGSITFRLKRTKKANHTYPLRLTRQQRQTLLDQTRPGRTLKKKLEQAGDGTQIVPVTWAELHTLNDETGQAAASARSPHKQRLLAVMSRVVKFFEEEHAGVFDLAAPTPAKPRPAKTGHHFQFKIALRGVEPAIWRRIQVQDCTLDKLHELIQAAMGWTNSHLHQFEIEGNRYGDPELLDNGYEGFACVDSTRTILSGILPKTGNRFAFKYEYDFGDGWEHEVVFEGRPPVDPKVKYPRCVEGERACPPEDCGGVWGYGDFLAAVGNPKHDEHASMLAWIGGRFDPDEFDPKKATKAMKKVT